MNYYCQWKGCEKFIIDNFSHSIANFSRKSMCLCVCVREYFYDDYPIRKITAINLTLYVKWVGFRKNIGAQPFVLYMMLNSQAEKFVLFNTTLDSRYPVFQKSILLSIIVDIESNTPFLTISQHFDINFVFRIVWRFKTGPVPVLAVTSTSSKILSSAHSVIWELEKVSGDEIRWYTMQFEVQSMQFCYRFHSKHFIFQIFDILLKKIKNKTKYSNRVNKIFLKVIVVNSAGCMSQIG